MHKLAVVTAALAVCVLPTACEVPTASPPTVPGGQSGSDLGTTAPVVVPVGNTSESASPTTTASRSRDRDRFRDRRTRTRKPRPTTTTTVPSVPVGNESPTETPAPTETVAPTDTSVPPTSDTTTAAPPTSAPPGLDLLGRTCAEGDNANLPAHTGFQAEAAQCVSTQMGAVAANDRLPQLLITEAPATINPGEAFFLKVSTRNLVRDRFLGAAAGGYYLEASFLDGGGLQRGHFHTACRMISSSSTAPTEAPAAERSPFFLATQDGGGGSTPDSVTIEVPADKTTQTGIMQCASWAGDGSHRTPMMSFANQIPAFDSVRINIGGSAPALPEAPAADAPAEAQADAQQQAEGEQQGAGQAPDQGGAAGEAPAPAPAPEPDPATPAADDPATPAAAESSSAAPASSGSLAERFNELRKQRDAEDGDN